MPEEVFFGGIERGRKPNIGDAQFFEVGQFLSNALEISAVPSVWIFYIRVQISIVLGIKKAIYYDEIDRFFMV